MTCTSGVVNMLEGMYAAAVSSAARVGPSSQLNRVPARLLPHFLQISALFVIVSVADAIIYENTLELATSVVIGECVLGIERQWPE
jgi:hypothetical protein